MSSDEVTTTKKSFWHTLPGIITGIAGIITAVTGLFLAINNFKSSKSSITDDGPTTEQSPDPSPRPEITIATAEKLTNDFLNAFKTRNVDDLMPLISVPFFNDHNIQTDLGEIRSRFQAIWQERGDNSFPEIKSIKVKTVKEWKDQGVMNGDRILHSLNITDDNYFAQVDLGKDALAIAFRIVDNKLKIAGIWD